MKFSTPCKYLSFRSEQQSTSDEIRVEGSMSWGDDNQFMPTGMPALSNVASTTKASKPKPAPNPEKEAKVAWLRCIKKDLDSADEMRQQLSEDPVTHELSKQLSTLRKAVVKHYNIVLGVDDSDAASFIAEALENL